MKRFALVLVLSFIMSGCLAVGVGGLFYGSAKNKEARQKFIADFNKTNLEREKAGLKPLDLCDSKYQFDRGWAFKDADCKKRYKVAEKN